LDPQNGRVEFYAPVVSGVDYKLAAPIKDYVSEFEASLKALSPDNVLFSCNCILNYLYSSLEGRRTGAFVGPATFGEIGFQLLNQTLVYLEIVKVASPTGDSNDTTLELSAAYEELQASERRFRTLSESAPIGIFLTDAAGMAIYENPRCRKLTGLSTEDAIAGDGWIKNIHPNDLLGVTAALKDSERESRDVDHEFRFVGPDGKIRWVHARTAFLRSETGENKGRIGTVEDISERKQAEIELERVNQDLIQASREAGIAEVSSGVLHNVKNVINSINISAGVIAEQLQRSQAPSLAKVTALLREHAVDLGSFITEHPKGKVLPRYLEQLAERLAVEREAILGELRQLEKSVQHVKEIVTMQQNCANLGTEE
jgi:PAS domain S-box-containing protein